MENNALAPSRLQFFPVMLFAVVMGFSGLTIAYQRANEIFDFPSLFGNLFMMMDILFFGAILLLYGLKLVKYQDEVKKEFQHPIRINFFAAISISILLLSIVTYKVVPSVAEVLFWIGVALHTFLTLYTISFWINHNFEINHSNPAWFIPIVGNVLIPVAGEHFASKEFLIFFFSIGMLLWVVLFTVILYRIIFHHQLAQKFIPTLFILIAPPAIGFLAYIKCGNQFDFFAHFLLDIGIFFTLLLGFMYKNFLKLKFFISWWAFTFPLAAITLASMLAYKMSSNSFYAYLSYFYLSVTTIVVFLVFYKTVQHILKREICVEE